MTKKDELEIKLKRIRALIQEKKLDAVYIKRQDDFSWLSCGGRNYLGCCGDMGLVGLLVTDNTTHAITNCIEGPRMRDEEHLEDLGFKMHEGLWYTNDFEQKTLSKLVSSDNIGFDYGSQNNIAEDIKKLRYSLTDSEIERMKELGTLATFALEEGASLARPGETENQVVARIIKILYDHNMEYAFVFAAADERFHNFRHAVSTDKKVTERLQLGGNIRMHGLTVCMSRYVNFVPVTEELRKKYRINQQIDTELMVNTVPGKNYNTTLLEAKAAYEKYGYAEEFDKHHLGGPIGYANRDFRVDPSHSGIIQENQAFCWNPSLTGTKSEDTIVVNKNGFEFITRPILFPKNEIVVNGKSYLRADILEKY